MTLRGTLAYRQKMALPRGGVETIIDLVDVTGGSIVSHLAMPAYQQVEIPFKLRVAKSAVPADHRYEIRAAIIIQNKRWFYGIRPVGIVEFGLHSKPIKVLLDPTE
jgi:uncharacterized lipoprotein YbaY